MAATSPGVRELRIGKERGICGVGAGLLGADWLRVPDFDVVEEAVLAAYAELDLGLGGVGDAGGLKVGGRFAVEGDTHFVADGFDNEGVQSRGGVSIRWFLAEEVAHEEVLQTALAVGAARPVPASGHDQEVEVFAGFDERIGETHG